MQKYLLDHEKKETSTASASGDAAADDESDPKDLPFQVQIRYTDIEGAVAMRVLTQIQPVTKDRQQAEMCKY